MRTPPLTDRTTVLRRSEQVLQRGLRTVAIGVFLACFLTVSVTAQPPAPGSSDLPVSRKRLTGARLEYHRSDPKLNWSFGKTTFVLTIGGETVPRELIKTLTGSVSDVARIEGTWELDEGKRELKLAIFQTDGEPVRHRARLPIFGVGLERVELGDLQYNVFPGEAELGEVPSEHAGRKAGGDPVDARVYVKVVLPRKPPAEGTSSKIESWIARKLRNRGTNGLRAVTEWIPLGETGSKYVQVWDAVVDGTGWGCPVAGRVLEHSTGGKLTVQLVGWSPAGAETEKWTLPAEIGSRRVVVIDTGADDGTGKAYVAIFIGPASANAK